MSNTRVPADRFMTKTSIGEYDFTCNPYVGCTHGCIYCYAKTIERRHLLETWGTYVDIKEYPNFDIQRGTGNKSLFLSSMTDPYQPIEKSEKTVRKILESIVDSNLSIHILTKSDLCLRDLDLFKQMKNFEIGLSISVLDEAAYRFEPGASHPSKRMEALKTLHDAGIKTHVFIAPILPYISQPLEIIRAVKNDVDYILVDSLNLSDDVNKMQFLETILKQYPHLYDEYRNIFINKDQRYYRVLRSEIIQECKRFNIPIKYIY